jgi:CrcB protein
MGNLTLGQLLAVAIGGSIGSVARWLTQVWLNGAWPGFPLGTLAVNWVGGFFIGMGIAYFTRMPDETLRLFCITGLLGGLTTFSAFSGESLGLLQRGAVGMALAHTAAHVLGSLALAALGYRVAAQMLA